MRWDVIYATLDELPDEVVIALSGEVRQEIRNREGEHGVRGDDASHDGSLPRHWYTPDGAMSPRNARKILAYRDLALGWKIARECARRRLPFPASLAWEGEAVYRAYLYALNPKRFPDAGIEEALFWASEAMRSQTHTIQAMLIANDTTRASICRALRLDEEVLRIYEHLFFNVTSRKEDALWLRVHVYPNTRMVEFYEGYVQSASFKQLLFRAGAKNGGEHVLQLAGVTSEPLDAMASAASAAQLESFLLTQGLLMAQNGWGNERSNATAIFHSRHLMAAAKMGGEDTQSGSEYLGLSDTLFSEMLMIKSVEGDRALRLQNAHDAIDAEATVL